jgi:histidinol-phosphatase
MTRPDTPLETAERDSDLAQDLALARELGAFAAALALDLQRRGVTVEHKPDGSPVTNADKEVERQLRDRLAAQRPHDAILGEEFGRSGSSSRCWVLDPIDGTSSFIAGRPTWGNHIALDVDGDIVLGVITRPIRGEIFWAARGGGAFRGTLDGSAAPSRLRVSTRGELASCQIACWTPSNHAHRRCLEREQLWVEANLDAVLRLCQGELDGVVVTDSMPWDHAPCVILVQEAGGRFSDEHGGRRLDLAELRLSNGSIHDALVALLDGGAKKG